ncbi:MAG: outer membrane protein assembly factor BamA [Deltaproteobacteria bacterium]|nr:outer membrane protein assembly factor BamA [Deltaproteobacteria bacterium]
MKIKFVPAQLMQLVSSLRADLRAPRKRNSRNRSGLAGCCFLLVFFLLPLAAAAVFAETATTTEADFSGWTVAEIVVLGNQKVTRDTITDKMSSRAGQPLSLATLNRDLKAIFDLGFFDNLLVNLTPVGDQVEVGIIVAEKPTIAAIIIKGNDKIKRKELLKEITLHTFNVLNQDRLQESLEKIKNLYHEKGFYSVEIKTRTVPAGKNRIQIVFLVDEGPKCYVKKIRFHGNDHFSSWTLKRQLQTKTYNLFLSWITEAGILKKDQLENDAKLLKSFYLSKGFVQVRVGKPEITLDENRKWIYLDYQINEGEVFTMGKVEIVDPEGEEELTANLIKILKGKSGETFSNLNLQSDIETLSTFFADRGFAYVDIDPRTRVDDEKLKVDVSYHVNRGDKFLFGRINIAGNTRTRDKVIRRELRFAEGDLFSASALKRSRERLNNTQFFSEADIQTAQQDNQSIDVNVKVVEASTGAFSVGLGYSTVDSIIGIANISQKNWLGRGLDATFNVELSGSRQFYNIGLTDPYFLDMNMSAGINIYDEEYEYDAYDTEQQGIRFHFGKPIDEYTSWSAGYRWEKVKIFNISDTASDYIRDEEGTTTTSQVYLSLIRDRRDNYLFPTRGYRLKGTVVFAGGPLGFDNDFYKVILEGHKFYPFKWDSAFHLWGLLGYADGYGGQKLPLYERFYVGGLKTLRGFDFGEAGPEDENGDVIGGTKELILSAEWIFPLLKDMGLKGVLFYDAGKAFDDEESLSFDLRHSVGFGIRWKSPMGPLRIEWGINLSPEDDEKSSVWDFSVGTFF